MKFRSSRYRKLSVVSRPRAVGSDEDICMHRRGGARGVFCGDAREQGGSPRVRGERASTARARRVGELVARRLRVPHLVQADLHRSDLREGQTWFSVSRGRPAVLAWPEVVEQALAGGVSALVRSPPHGFAWTRGVGKKKSRRKMTMVFIRERTFFRRLFINRATEQR